MHLKAIPEEAVTFAGDHKWLLFGGAAVLVAGYLYVHHQSTSAASNGGVGVSYGDPVSTGLPTTTLDTSSLGGAYGDASSLSGGSQQTTVATVPTSTDLSTVSTSSGFSDPSSFVSSTGNVGTVVGQPTGGTDGTGSPLDALTQLQFLTQNDDYSFAMQQLKDATDIAFANINLSALALVSSNYATSAFLAQAFLNSPDQAAAFSVGGGAPGSQLTFTGVQFQNSNKNGFDANLTTMLNNGTIANAINLIMPQATSQPASTALAAPLSASNGGFTPAPVISANGSSVAAPVSSSTFGVSASSIGQITGPAPIASLPSTRQTTTVGGGGGGGGAFSDGGRLQQS